MSAFANPEELLRRTRSLRALARGLVHDAHAAEDVVQDAFVAALRRPPDPELESNAWWTTVVRHFAFRRRRGIARQNEREVIAARPETVEGADQVAERASLMQRVVAEVLALPEPYRRTLLLRYFEDLSPRAIAARESVPIATVKSRLARGLERLRARLDDELEGGRGAWMALIAPQAWAKKSITLATGGLIVGLKLVSVVAAVVVASALLFVGWNRWNSALAPGPSTVSSNAQLETPKTTELAAVAATNSEHVPIATANDVHSKSLASVDVERLLRGRVVDSHAQPIAGARVEVRRSEIAGVQDLEDYETHEQDPTRVAATTTSDEHGEFAVQLAPVRTYELDVSAPGFATSDSSFVRTGQVATVVLTRGATVHGHVVKESDGSPCPGATIRILVRSWPEVPTHTAVETDERGEYTFAGLPAGRVYIGAFPREGEQQRLDLPAIHEGEWIEHDFTIPNGVTITGHVSDARTGEPIEGALVGDSKLRGVRTSHDGRYTFVGLTPGSLITQRLSVQATGYASLHKYVEGSEAMTRELDFALSPSFTARGRVVRADGEPADGAYVAALAEGQAGRDARSMRTGADGVFELTELPREENLTLFICRDDCGSKMYDFPAIDAARSVLDFGEVRFGEAGSIEGIVLDENAGVRPNMIVELTGGNSDQARYTESGSEHARGNLGQRRTRSDARGRFAFSDLSAGSYSIGASIKGSGSHPLENVQLGAGEARTGVVLTMTLGSTISGVVVDLEGRPLYQASVMVYPEPYAPKDVAYSVTEGDGSFLIQGLSGGSFELVVETRFIDPKTPSEKLSSVRVKSVKAGTSDLRIEVPYAAHISGRVTLPNGAPSVRAEVAAMDMSRQEEVFSISATYTNDNGDFQLDVSPSSSYRLTVWPHSVMQQMFSGGDHAEERLIAVLNDVAPGAHDLVMVLRPVR